MSSPTSRPPLGGANDFDHIRFETFRGFSTRLGFLLACFPVLTLFADLLESPDQMNRFLLARLIGSLILLVYPAACRKDIPRKYLPWILYSGMTLLLVLVAHEQIQYGRAMEMLYTGSILLFITPILGMPFPWKVNAICEISLFLLFAAFMYSAFGLTAFTLRVGVLSVLVLVAIDFIYRQFERIIRIQHYYLRRIEKMAIKDVLSGQYNRRYFLEIGARVLLRCSRYGRPVSLALIDIDHFKTVNDRFGHDAGDVVIRETAQCMRQKVRETDLVARWGGEEFVVLLPESDREASLVVAERVRREIEAMSIQVAGLAEPIKITASLGLAEARHEQDSLKTLVKKADQALYRAKESGRNRVVVQEEEAKSAK